MPAGPGRVAGAGERGRILTPRCVSYSSSIHLWGCPLWHGPQLGARRSPVASSPRRASAAATGSGSVDALRAAGTAPGAAIALQGLP